MQLDFIVSDHAALDSIFSSVDLLAAIMSIVISVNVIVIVNRIDLFPLTVRFRYRFFCITFSVLDFPV